MGSDKLNVHTCELLKTSHSNLPRLGPNAKFFTRWRRAFQKWIIVFAEHPQTRFYLRSQAAVAFERRRHSRSPYWWVIHPCSKLRFGWDIIMLITLAYFFILAPYVISFQRVSKNRGPDSWHIVYPAFVICIIDIFLNFVTGFIAHNKNEIYLDPSLTAKQYVLRYFFIDLVSSVPYCWLYEWRIEPSGPNSDPLLLFCEFLPLLKLLRLPTFHHYVGLVNTTIYGMVHCQGIAGWLIIMTILICHWGCCFTNVFPYITMHLWKERAEDSDAYVIRSGLYKKSDARIYFISFHIAVCNLIGSSFVELDFTSRTDTLVRGILLFVGIMFLIYTVVTLLQIVISRSEPELTYEAILHEVQEYVHEKKLPKSLKDKLIAYYQYRYQGSYFKEFMITGTLSSNLNDEIMLRSCHRLLESCPIFQNLPHSFLRSFVAVLKPTIYLEDDIVYKADLEGDCMYFVLSGTVALITFSGKEICHVQDGGYFGETPLIFPNQRRRESAIALEVCELLRCDRQGFKVLVDIRSEFYSRLEAIAKERLHLIDEIEDKSGGGTESDDMLNRMEQLRASLSRI